MKPPSAGSIGRWATLLLLAVALACAPARRKVEGDVVHEIHFTGNGGFVSGHNDYQLRQQMEQQSSGLGILTWPLVYSVDPKLLDEGALLRDAYRLEVWYAHQGWFDARVRGWQIRQIRARSEKRAGVVDIRGFVDTGPQSVVRLLDVQGVDTGIQAVVNAALRGAPLQEGAPFSLLALTTTRDAILDKLRDYSRAYASVATEVTAFPEQQAVDVTITVDAGIPCVLGPITVEGEQNVDEQLIRDRMRLVSGEKYSQKDLRDARQRLFKVGTFSVVTIQPDLSDPSNAQVPLLVKVTEAKFRTLRAGIGFDYDSYLPVVRVSTRFTHTNLLHELLRAEIGAQAGIAIDLGEDRPLPTWALDAKLAYPRIAHQRGAIELSGKIEQQIYVGLWTYRRPQADLHFVWNWNEHVIFRLGPHFEQYTVVTPDLTTNVTADTKQTLSTLLNLFGIEGDSLQYQLTSLDQFGTWDWRDDPRRPTRGSYYAVSLREAFKLSSVGTSFLRATGEARRYLPLRFRDRNTAFPLTLAGKVRATGVIPYGPSTTVPLPERAFVGGPNSIRGFRANQVGPYSTVCVYNTTSRSAFFGFGGSEPYELLSRYDLPQGGELSGEVSGEVRYDWTHGITLAAFADAGFLTADAAQLGPEDGRWSVGVGARYDTVIGPIRFDVSFRPLYPEDEGPLSGFQGCQAARWNGRTFVDDRQVRVNDFFANFPGLRDPASHPPFALVFFITIGESI